MIKTIKSFTGKEPTSPKLDQKSNFGEVGSVKVELIILLNYLQFTEDFLPYPIIISSKLVHRGEELIEINEGTDNYQTSEHIPEPERGSSEL